MEQRKKYILFTLTGMVLVLLVLFGVYTIIDFVPAVIEDSNLTARAIDTPGKQLLNGYLGHFFRFKFLGNLNWLMLPILVHFFLTLKQRERWEKALVFLYALSLLLIGLQGFFNYRYAQTLMPFTLVMVLVSVWRFFEAEQVQFLRKYVMLFLLVLVGFNTWHYLPFGGDAGRVTIVEDREPVNAEVPVEVAETPSYQGKMSVFKNALLSGDVPNLRENRTPFKNHPEIPADVLEFIDGIELGVGEQFLTNNIPMIYYYTDQKTLYYWCEDDIYYDAEGYHKLFGDVRTNMEVFVHLRDNLNIRYILTRDIYNTYSDKWNEFIQYNSELIYKDPLGFEVYQLNEEFFPANSPQ